MTIPSGIFQCGRVGHAVYAVLVRGFLGGSCHQTLKSLSRRTSLSTRTLQRTLCECVELGWVRYVSGPHGERLYTRHAPGPYVRVVDPPELKANSIAHRVFMLLQMVSMPDISSEWLKRLSCSRSTLCTAFKELENMGLISGKGRRRVLSPNLGPTSQRNIDPECEMGASDVYALLGRGSSENNLMNILDKSLNKANHPPTEQHGRASILKTYKEWKDAGRPDLGGLHNGDAARVILAHYACLAASVEDIFIPLDRRGVAAFVNVIEWIEYQERNSDDDFEAQRICRLSGGNARELVLRAVMSTFSNVCTYRKYGVALVTTINADKNTFNSIALNTFIKANKTDPNWFHKYRRGPDEDKGTGLRKESASVGTRVRLKLSNKKHNNPRPGRGGDTPKVLEPKG